MTSQVHELMKEIEQESLDRVKSKYETKVLGLLQKMGNKRSRSANRLESSEQFSLESTPKKSSMLFSDFHQDKEMSIRELQIQQKLEEIKRLESMEASSISKSSPRKHILFQEVLVRPQKDKVRESLTKSSKRENLSVERIARTSSPFKRSKA